MINETDKKTIFVAICGRPNVGKSTILNQLIQEKLSAVTPKAQTTWNSIKGILTYRNTQVVFTDTPGIFSARNHLQKAILKNAWMGLKEVDLLCFVIDASKGWGADIQNFANILKKKNENLICVMNKTDKVSHPEINFKMMHQITNSNIFNEIIPMCAKKNKGTDILREYILSQAYYSPWHYAEDDLTNKSNAFIASEMTRETIFFNLHDELPYNVNVDTVIFTFHPDCIEIKQEIIASKESYKKIIIGEHGRSIKAIKNQSCIKMKKFFQKEIELSLFVKVKYNWTEKFSLDSDI